MLVTSQAVEVEEVDRAVSDDLVGNIAVAYGGVSRLENSVHRRQSGPA
jgi:hypothetical protein